MTDEKKTILDQLREFKESKDYERLPPTIKLLVEFAEKRGLFDEKKAARKELPNVMPVEELKKIPERISYKKAAEIPEIPVSLSNQEFEKISKLGTANKAIEIVKKYLRDRYGPNIDIHTRGTLGADIRIVFEGGKEELIEVKGTEEPDVTWSQLKVSSQQSHDNLCKGIPLYRVIDVDSKTPRILILKYGRDFDMRPEPRWAVKPVRR